LSGDFFFCCYLFNLNPAKAGFFFVLKIQYPSMPVT
jgi:hypothetical protein